MKPPEDILTGGFFLFCDVQVFASAKTMAEIICTNPGLLLAFSFYPRIIRGLTNRVSLVDTSIKWLMFSPL
ncbi:hypothetical protein AYY16_18900 [Morganella psychrotolerans]|nr:hypothetical protein AYY16_18900 [Morganella psychrotolerans]